MSTEPLFWYRPRTDGGYEGPLHNGQIEDVRKASGAWVPLFAVAAPVSAEPVAWMTHHDEPMLFPTEAEAQSYCDDDEQPIPLYEAPVSAEPMIEATVCGYTPGQCLVELRLPAGWRLKGLALELGDAVIISAAPVAAQPDLTQQTLDDVMAGIPARDAEIAELRKQVETLQAQLVDRSPEMQRKPVDESPNLQGQQQPVSGADGLLSDQCLIAFAEEEQFMLFCDEGEFLQIARAVLQRFCGKNKRSQLSGNPGELPAIWELPKLTEPEAPANTAGLPWHAHTNVQMLSYGRACAEAQRKADQAALAQQDADKAGSGQDYNDGFSDGVILALQLMTMHGDYNGTQYCELLTAAGPNQIVERAIREGMWEMSGLSQTPTAVERRAAIDAARKEQA